MLIVAECGNLEVVYPDPAYMGVMVGIWSASRNTIWQKLYNTTLLEYDPIANYDRTEEYGETGESETGRKYDNELSRSGTDAVSQSRNSTVHGVVDGSTQENSETGGSDTTTNNLQTHTSETKGSTSTSETTDTRSGSVEEKVSSYNSASYEPAKMTTTSETVTSDANGTTNTTGTINETKTGDVTTTRNGTEKHSGTTRQTSDTTDTGSASSNETHTASENGSGTESEEASHIKNYKLRAYGNIGVTTTQQMIESEREVAQFSIYDFIVNDFKHFFCLLVY